MQCAVFLEDPVGTRVFHSEASGSLSLQSALIGIDGCWDGVALASTPEHATWSGAHHSICVPCRCLLCCSRNSGLSSWMNPRVLEWILYCGLVLQSRWDAADNRETSVHYSHELRNQIYTSSRGSITFEVWLMLTPSLVVLGSTVLTSLHNEQGAIRHGGEGKGK